MAGQIKNLILLNKLFFFFSFVVVVVVVGLVWFDFSLVWFDFGLVWFDLGFFLSFSDLSPSYSEDLSFSLQAAAASMTSKHNLELQHPVAIQTPITSFSLALGGGAGFHELR